MIRLKCFSSLSSYGKCVPRRAATNTPVVSVDRCGDDPHLDLGRDVFFEVLYLNRKFSGSGVCLGVFFPSILPANRRAEAYEKYET